MFLFAQENLECPGCHLPSQKAPAPILLAALEQWRLPGFVRHLAEAMLKDGASIPYCPTCGIVFGRVK